jgi:DMSO/TMAO reductase YedYZ molybdopterin-dependent catalytic subunit
MTRILGSVGLVALVAISAATRLYAVPASAHPVVALAPSPQVSVTTLPALPTMAPNGSATAPTTQPGSASGTGSVAAPPGSVIQVVGDVADPRVMTLKDVQLLRRSSLTLRVLDPDGKRRIHTYTGVLLRDLISSVSPIGPGGAVTSTHAYAFIEGMNGDSAIIAFPEFEVAYNNKQILLAYLIDGTPPPGPAICDLVVPEDQTQGRFITGVTTIRIGSPEP